MTKSRKIYIGVFAISIAVLIWDRITQDPSGSLIQPVQARRVVAPETSNTNVQTDWDLTPGVLNMLSKNKLGEHWQDEQEETHRNIFSLSSQFRELIKIDTAPQDLPASANHKTQNPIDEIELAKQLQLTSILVARKHSCAMINGKIIYIGQDIGPFRLIKIYKEAVLLQRKKGRILLSINKL